MSERIDYEAEYNNRARVPEHPAIIEGWTRDAEAYRQAVGARFEAHTYGGGERQTLHIFRPEEDRGGALVVFIHGGYWQAFGPSTFSHMAAGLNQQGITVAVPGYDLCPAVRVGDIVDQMRQACATLAREGRPLVVAGHSAGGHLAACMLASDWTAIDQGLRRDLVPAAYTVSGLFDLPPLIDTNVNKALRMDEAEARASSPLFWPAPAGRLLDAVVGGEESGEYLRQSREIVDRWGAEGVATRLEIVPGANHFTVIAPLADPNSAMTRRIADLARTVG